MLSTVSIKNENISLNEYLTSKNEKYESNSKNFNDSWISWDNT
jgi:hypothetical protein